MRLRVLGCSGGVGKGLRTTSFLVDDDVLIDAGSGVGDLTIDEMCGIRHIFLTHSHLDHVAFLPLLVDSIFDCIKEPIVIHGRKETLEALQMHIFNWTIWPDFSRLPDMEHPVMRYEVMVPGTSMTLGQRRIDMIEVNHIVPGVAYRVECPTGAFAYSGDTTTNENLWNQLNARDRLDLLIVEAAFSNADGELSRKAGHYTPITLGADCAKLRHKPHIYVSHIKPGQELEIMEECRQAINDRPVSGLQGGEVFEL